MNDDTFGLDDKLGDEAGGHIDAASFEPPPPKPDEVAARVRLQSARDALSALIFGLVLVCGVAVIGIATGNSDALALAKDVSLVAIGGIVSSLNRNSIEATPN